MNALPRPLAPPRCPECGGPKSVGGAIRYHEPDCSRWLAKQARASLARVPTDAEVLAWVRARWPDRCGLDARAMKLGEEAGEAVGAATRIAEGRGTRAALAKELAQVVMCVKGLAAAADVDLDAAVRAEWVDMQTRQWPGARGWTCEPCTVGRPGHACIEPSSCTHGCEVARRLRLDGYLDPLEVFPDCPHDTEHDGTCPADPCECRRRTL